MRGADPNEARSRPVKDFTKISLPIAALTLALGLQFAAPAPVEAAEPPRASKVRTMPLYQNFTWSAPRKARSTGNFRAKRLHAIKVSARGRGSWICSPSGSGRRASCYSRR